mmetsp:Transcript_86140/g.150204  ORF Transcript_86140/g.150204 Transcript_86140/m.150204 type:complete len:95 (+) Transcript_86140:490-774(+)
MVLKSPCFLCPAWGSPALPSWACVGLVVCPKLPSYILRIYTAFPPATVPLANFSCAPLLPPRPKYWPTGCQQCLPLIPILCPHQALSWSEVAAQ